MKRWFCFAILLFAVFVQKVEAQSDDGFYVEKQNTSTWGDANIVGVVNVKDYTLVVFNYITSRYCSGCWISISSSTVIKSSKLNKNLKIEGWGILNGDDIEPLSLDEKYNVSSDRKYSFVLLFPRIPKNIKVFDIDECAGRNGFKWEGIHFNNEDVEDDGVGGNSDDRRSSQPTASGTCFAISSDGYLVTCYHVVENADRILIRGVNEDFDRAYTAKVEVWDKNNDLAILRILDPKFDSISGIPYMINNNLADVGENVFVLGYPLRAIMGDEIKLTNGLVSSRSGFQGDITLYQVSATVQPGNSGGPVFDEDGNIIGVINSRLVVENATYAIKSSYINVLISNINSKIKTPNCNKLREKKLSEKVKDIKKYIYIIEVE